MDINHRNEKKEVRKMDQQEKSLENQMAWTGNNRDRSTKKDVNNQLKC